ncbi:MAG: xanthine dehydrogenase accessory protein XdhC [Fuerstiella sp.]|nr:xanthine dehydrogenase accessory protein XdhC [Fuerstiella sp.]MCP4855974.1 xanthine dehydrogenase accessory protein XdhC [Fuerstiella sp.]
MAFDVHRHWQKVSELLQNNTPFAVVTMVDVRGSAPQIPGAKAVVTSDGVVDGTVGGGKVEARAVAQAIDMLKTADGCSCQLVTWNLQTDIGMTCGGEAKFFFELFLCNDWKVSLFGAGHIAQALVPILLQMNCRVTWLDQRPEWLSRVQEHPKLTKICTQNLQDEVKQLDPGSFFVLMTQGHATDLPVLAEVLQTMRPPYVGVLGSLQKAKILRRDLKGKGFSDEKIASFFCPMGLPIGNNTPPEIAISVLSQLIQERDRLGIIEQRTKSF